MTARELDLRRVIFESFAATGEAPEAHELDADVLAELERRHVVVLRDGRVWMAHPFAGHRRGTRVAASYGREWWGNCAWDGLGIVAALGLSSAVITSGGLTVRVISDQVIDDALFHVAVPARYWWDDIEFT
jgi:Alkylmercury lyase